MGLNTDWALEIEGTSKTFRPFRWPWTRPEPAPVAGEDSPPGGRSVRALDQVSLRVRRGEIVGVLGPNGSGKSTLIRIVATLIIADSGQVRVFGHELPREERAVKRVVNRVSVEASFFKKLSPMENLIFGARLYGLDAATGRQRALAILRRLGLRERSIWEPMEQMSRGCSRKWPSRGRF